jgi:hypothetical protein
MPGLSFGRLMIQPAYNFALAEQKRMFAKGDPELIGRYILLRSNFESRLALWGVSEEGLRFLILTAIRKQYLRIGHHKRAKSEQRLARS